MRILHAKIFGFGKWVDYSMDFPATGALFIYGENESGKTTFHQFILFMLFGMPPRQRNLYQPKMSSKFGGQLVMEDEEVGEFTIERLGDRNNGAATCYTETGEQLPENWLRERMYEMNLKTFEAVFSFSALDLNRIEEMDEADLGEILLSIGLTGSDNIYRVEKQLDAQLDKLFKPTGRRPEMNEQLNRLENLKRELEEKRKETANYHDKSVKAEELSDKLKELQKNQQLLHKEITFLTKQHTTLPIIHEYQFLQQKERMQQDIRHFPENGISRLEKIQEELRPLESDLAALKNNEARNLENIERNRANLLSRALFQDLQDNRAEVEKYKKNEKKLADFHTAKRELYKEMLEELNDLQIDLEQEELADLSLPFYIEETWKQLQTAHTELERDTTQLQSEKKGLEKERLYLEEEHSQIRKSLLPAHDLEDSRTRLNQGRDYKQLNKLYDETLKMKSNVEKEKKQKYKRTNQLLGISIILFFISVVAAFLFNESLLFIIGLFFLIGGVAQWIFIRQNIKSLEAMIQQPINPANTHSLSEEEMYLLEKELKEDEEKRLELSRIEAAIKDQHIKVVQWEEKERMHLERIKRTKQQREEQIVLYPFLDKIQMNYWPEYYRRIKQVLKLNDTYLPLVEEIKILHAEQKLKKKELIHFWEQTFPEEKVENIGEIEDAIGNKLEEKKQITNRLQLEERLMEENIESIASLHEQISVYQKEIDKLLQSANTPTVEAFYKLGNDVLEKNKIKEALLVNERQLEAAFPEGTWKKFINKVIDEAELKQTRDNKSSQAAELEERVENVRTDLAALQAELNRLESSDAYSEKIHLFEMEREKFNQQAKEWSILKVEKEILTETKISYREKYLSHVLTETATIFKGVTGGKYTDVLAPTGKELFQIRAADGLRYTVNELSQGTMNQLYISLRLAISKVMSEKERLPFILDDAFVHFDDTRVKRILTTLADIGKNQQVIMFTCKTDVRSACEEQSLPIKYIG